MAGRNYKVGMMFRMEIPFPGSTRRRSQSHSAYGPGAPGAGAVPDPLVCAGLYYRLVLGWWYANRIAGTPKLWGEAETSPVSRTDIDDFAFFAMIGILLGGRIGYVLFYTLPYEPDKLAQDPMFILRMWEGGMSFHGGLIGASLAVVYTAWARKLKLLSLGDVACAAAPIGLFLGGSRTSSMASFMAARPMCRGPCASPPMTGRRANGDRWVSPRASQPAL